MYGNTCGMYSDNSGFERYLRSRVITSMITDFAKVDISLNEIKNGDCFIGYMFECLWPDKL